MIYIIKKERCQDFDAAISGEFLLGGGSGKEKVESPAGMVRKRATRCSNRRRAGAMNEGNNKVTTGSQELRGVAYADARPIFSESHIAHIVAEQPRFSFIPMSLRRGFTV